MLSHYLAGMCTLAALAGTTSASTMEENKVLHDKLLNFIQQSDADATTSANGQTSNAATDFTQANCDTTNQYYVAQLPGFTGQSQEWPCSYAGTLKSSETENHNLFFWMYPAISADAPVAVWLNGGPGTSSTFANFLFSSPLRISEPTTNTFTM